MVYGCDYSEYDIFRLSLQGHCDVCFTKVNDKNMCICCGEQCRVDNSVARHPVVDIYHQWQLTFSRGWKWNDAHRRGVDIYKYSNVQVHHKSIYPLPRRVQLFGPYFTNRQKRLAEVISSVLRTRRIEESSRRSDARKWKLQWVFRHNPEEHVYTYERWMQGPQTEWMSIARELGLTYRHIRPYGYIPYVMEAESLHNEHRLLWARASEILQQRREERNLLTE
jgi:hypothetical protein